VHYHALRKDQRALKAVLERVDLLSGIIAGTKSRRRLFPCGHRVHSSGPGQPVLWLASGLAKGDVAGVTAPLDRMVSRT
jgi:hypothetical protein